MKESRTFAIIIDLIVMALMLNIVNNANINTIPSVLTFITSLIIYYSTIVVLGALLASTSLKKIVWKVILTISYLTNYLVDNTSNKKEC